MEVWKDVLGFEGLYQVSSIGNVRSLDRVVNCKGDGKATKKSKVMTGQVYKHRYVQFLLSVTVGGARKQHMRLGHRLVAESFIENPNNLPCVNHKDSNRTNNSVENLEWVTYAENIEHARAKGHFSGMHNSAFHRKLDPEKIAEIKALLAAGGMGQKAIGAKFGVTQASISLINRDKSWKPVLQNSSTTL